MIERLRDWARRLKREIMVLWLAARDPRTPLLVKLLAGAVTAYALSPIDLIPDFIPVLGLLDDLLIVPLGIALAIHVMPPPLLDELRRAAAQISDRPASRRAAFAIVAIWLAAAAIALSAIARL